MDDKRGRGGDKVADGGDDDSGCDIVMPTGCGGECRGGSCAADISIGGDEEERGVYT